MYPGQLHCGLTASPRQLSIIGCTVVSTSWIRMQDEHVKTELNKTWNSHCIVLFLIIWSLKFSAEYLTRSCGPFPSFLNSLRLCYLDKPPSSYPSSYSSCMPSLVRLPGILLWFSIDPLMTGYYLSYKTQRLTPTSSYDYMPRRLPGIEQVLNKYFWRKKNEWMNEWDNEWITY